MGEPIFTVLVVMTRQEAEELDNGTALEGLGDEVKREINGLKERVRAGNQETGSNSTAGDPRTGLPTEGR